MEGDQDDHPCPESIVLSQTCWEYRTLLGKEQQQAEQKHYVAYYCRKTNKAAQQSRAPAPKGDSKTSLSTDRAPRCAGTTGLRTLRLEGQGDNNQTANQTAGSWDIFVLVLQASGLQRITSKRGSEVDFGTLLIADQSLSFFRLTLWGKTARSAGRLIRAGDLVRFNRIGVSSFRGTVQASSTRSTSFRVVWRGDAFTIPQDAPSTTMLAHGWSASRAPGERRRFDPGPVLSQDDDLKVSREAGCALAAWAKSEFPSVTSAEPYGHEQKQCRHQQATAVVQGTMCGGGGGGAGGCDASWDAGSLGAVRKGVETTVRACVVEVSHVERLWVWESAGGEGRVATVGSASALLEKRRYE
ncbi:unnamed protein product, partial [Hapterophycus canaliculatus]